ncbi:NAD-dependent epimerase/dehydratase family protein [Magnetospirillum moscoviense]|uniref:Epimerase n=1 Tax=Magnetospirillum moscoviense TaxID=1437059 RepID=A0A178MTG4_9PROT|nr:NAD-dependent epimerase/dehydratase family protein [Magnetospirillum moscoviense]OAN51554.1 epimerase [Magnetospirillum moscoviense]
MSIYLITGGAGFIGSHLAEWLLNEGHAVRILDDLSTGRRENVPDGARLVIGDVADPNAAMAAMVGTAGCFHLAAIASVPKSNEDWLGTHRTNLSGTIAILNAARRCGRIPVVYASSAAVYGDNPTMPLDEAARTLPLSAYGADKLGCELHARIGTLVHGIPSTGFRFFNVYGPRQDPHSPYSGVISIFANRLLAGSPVTVFGDGLQTRDFIYVGDVVDHLVAAMRHPPPTARIFNACTGRQTTLLHLIEILGGLIHVTPRIDFAAAHSSDIRHSLGSPDLCVRELGVRAATGLPRGLEATLDSLRGLPAGGIVEFPHRVHQSRLGRFI